MKYKKPVITAIKLDPRNAVLVTCQEGGNYFWSEARSRSCVGGSGRGWPCGLTIRGHDGGDDGGNMSGSEQPS